MGVAPSVPLDPPVYDDTLHPQQQQQEESISISIPTRATKQQSPDDNDSSSYCFAGHAANSSSKNSLQSCVPALIMSPDSSCNSMEEQCSLPYEEQDEQEVFSSLLRSQNFDLHDEGLEPTCSLQQAPFSNDSGVSSLVSACFTCTPRVVDLYETYETHPTTLESNLEDDPPCLVVLPFRRCSRVQCHCRLWNTPSLEPSLSNPMTKCTPGLTAALGAGTRVRARSVEYTSYVAISSPPLYASSSSSRTTASPPSTHTRKARNPLPRSRKHEEQHLPYNKQRSRSEDVIDIPNTTTTCTNRSLSPSCPQLGLPNTSQRIKSQSGRERCPRQQPLEPMSRRLLYKSQSERTIILQSNPMLSSTSVPSNNRKNCLPPNQERIVKSDVYSRDRANSEATTAASSDSSSSSSSGVICLERQLAHKKSSSERSPFVFSRSEASLRRLRCRSEDLVDVPNHSHFKLQERHAKNTEAAATVPTESPTPSKRIMTPASPTSVLDLSSVLVEPASEESSQQYKFKLPTIRCKVNLDELLQDAFRFESQGNPLLALETYRASLDVAKRCHHRSNCNPARIYHRMGLLHYQMGNYHPSLRVLEQALEVISLSYGCLDLQLSTSFISDLGDVCELVTEISLAVARVHLSLGSIRDAKHAARRGLAMVQNRKSSQVLFHEGLVVLGMVYELDGRWKTALSHYQQALSFQHCHHQHHYLSEGHHHTSVAATISCIGNIYTKQGWLGPAMECFRESIRIYSLSKSSTLDIGLTLASIGWIQWRCGDLVSAIRSTTDALYIVQAALGDGHRNTCTLRYQLGMIQARQGHFRAALKTLTLVLHAQRSSLGDDHEDVAITCDAIGDLYHHQLHKSKRAATSFLQALDIRQRARGKKHLLVATSYSRLGLMFGKIGNPSESRVFLAKTLAIYQSNHLPLSDFRVQRVQQALGRLPPTPSQPVALSSQTS